MTFLFSNIQDSKENMGLDNIRCKIQDRISKQTVLAMLQAPSVVGVQKGESVQWTDENGRTKTYRVYSVGNTQVGLEDDSEIIYVEKSSVVSNSTKPVFLDKVPLENWTIDSFDAKNRTVCVTINNGVSPQRLTITLPVAGYSLKR